MANVACSRVFTAVSGRSGARRDVRAAAGKRPTRSPFLNGPAEVGYLSPDLPGFKNWDPLELADPTRYPEDEKVMNIGWLSYAELIHGRWAMLGAAGVVAPEFLGRWGVIPTETALPWFEAGGLFPDAPGSFAYPFANVSAFEYWANAPTLAWTMVVAMGFAEGRRYMDYKNPGSQSKQYFLGIESVLGGSGDPKYPGGQFFDIFNLSSRLPEDLAALKSKEVNNGRLAMVAMAGFAMQANVTRVGPVQNLEDILDPTQATATLLDSPNAGLYFPYLAVTVGGGALLKWAFDQEEQTMAKVAAEAAEAAEAAAVKAAEEAAAVKAAEEAAAADAVAADTE